MNIKKIFIAAFLVCCCLFLITAGCNKTNGISSIALKDYSDQAPVEIAVGGFCFSNYVVIVTHDNGKVTEIPLTEDMISETDKLKFYQEGEQEVGVNYMGASTTIKVNVVRKQFASDVTFSDLTVTYTGEVFSIQVQGNIPVGTNILYPQGNTFQNAGEYDVTAILQCEGYVTKTLSARVVIQKADYDVSNAILYDKTVTYDKEYHTIRVSGVPTLDVLGNPTYEQAELPKGVSVSYTITKIKDGYGVDIPTSDQQTVEGNNVQATEAGSYLICAKYKGDLANYNPIPNSTAVLTIEQAVYDTTSAILKDANVVYSGDTHYLEISPDYEMPSDLTCSYQIKKIKTASGELVEEEFAQGNGAINAGTYIVKIAFEIVGKNASNYKPVPAEKQAQLVIEQNDYTEIINKLNFDYQYYVYEEDKEYRAILSGQLPEGVTPSFVVKNKDGEIIEGVYTVENSQLDLDDGQIMVITNHVYTFKTKEAGEYTCLVSYSHDNQNYKQIEGNQTQIFVDSLISSLSVVQTEEGVLSFESGSFDYGKYSLVIIEENENFEVALSEDMLLSEDEKLKFSQEGNQTIKFVYKGYSFSIEIQVTAPTV